MKSTIKTIDKVTPYEKNGKTTFYHNLVMDNGDKINIGKTKE